MAIVSRKFLVNFVGDSRGFLRNFSGFVNGRKSDFSGKDLLRCLTRGPDNVSQTFDYSFKVKDNNFF